jgi:hypothetical protein
MKHLAAKVSVPALVVLFMVSASWSQTTPAPQGQQTQPTGQQGQQQPGAQGGRGQGGGRGAAPAATKDETAAYKLIYDGRGGDPMHIIDLGEAFVIKYPMSVYLKSVYAELTDAYSRTNQNDKMMDAGSKTLALDPDNVDVLPLLAFTIPRVVTSKTVDGPQQLEKAQAYAHHGIELLSALVKPANIDDATFTKNKNEKLSMCHDGLGVIAVKTGKYDVAITELNQSLQLTTTPDPTDYYLLGVANVSANHFQDGIAAFNKCAAVAGAMQSTCKSGADDAKKKAQTNIEAPK